MSWRTCTNRGCWARSSRDIGYGGEKGRAKERGRWRDRRAGRAEGSGRRRRQTKEHAPMRLGGRHGQAKRASNHAGDTFLEPKRLLDCGLGVCTQGCSSRGNGADLDAPAGKVLLSGDEGRAQAVDLRLARLRKRLRRAAPTQQNVYGQAKHGWTRTLGQVLSKCLLFILRALQHTPPLKHDKTAATGADLAGVALLG